jgi:hypothetical protein
VGKKVEAERATRADRKLKDDLTIFEVGKFRPGEIIFGQVNF